MNVPAPSEFVAILHKKFPHTPTAKQELALEKLAHFITRKKKDEIFLLKGFAGTGKTTLLATLVHQLWNVKMSTVLMAPTGRAAKVMSVYAKDQAFTIHKKIYVPKLKTGGNIQFVLTPNKHRNTLFIVDEASMIPDRAEEAKLFENGSLLDDLIFYVLSGYNCKLILVGDTAQLPPVKLDLSPALEEQRLAANYNKQVESLELDEVVRQAGDSGIFYNATTLRQQIQDQYFTPFQFKTAPFKDIIRLKKSSEIQQAINTSYTQNGKEETVILVRSNKRANRYNQSVRERILFLNNELAVGDYIMVVKNNYFWLQPDSEAGFIANGDIIEVLEIFSIQQKYGFTFAEVTVKMADYPNQKPFTTILLLNTLRSETPSLSYEEGNTLYQEILKDYAHETSKYKKFRGVKNNKFFNALQVKFSYAITCHKAQGGQWHTVFVEQPYLPNGVDREYLRWLYTAITRAKHQLYLIGFTDNFFG